MEYQDFTIDLRSVEGGFEAAVAAAPLEDTPCARFAAPIPQEELDALLASFDHLPGAPQAPPVPRSHEVGETLYRALFDNPIGELFQRCRDALTHAEGTGLRLRLRFRDDDPQHEYLSALPWEWLWDRESRQFVATDLATPVVRNLAYARAAGPLAVAAPLRILVVEAPPCSGGLNLRQEIDRMNQALGLLQDAGQVLLLGLNRATPDDLRHALRDERINVLHFLGHGGYDPKTGSGAIFLAREDGAELQVEGERFAACLKDVPSLRLVVLNGCKTARHAGADGAAEAGGGRFVSGVAAAVLRQTRVPAVVATQGSISDDTAIRWSEIFYRRLASGDGVDEAITEARLALSNRCRDWGLPVLYLSGPHGKLFAFEPAERRRVVRLLGRSRPAGEAVRLSVRTFRDGHGRDLDAEGEGVLDLSRYFSPPEHRFIRRPEDWQENVFPELRNFLRSRAEERRPLELHFAAHVSLAFAAGWLLEPKSGFDVWLPQRTREGGETRAWHAKDGSEAGGADWLPGSELVLDPARPDLALALAVTWSDVKAQAKEFIERVGLPVGRLLEATVPAPGQHAVQGGAHALRLAETLLPRLLARQPHERGGRLHIFSATPNALAFYLGQLLSPVSRLVLYEYAFKAEGNFGRYQKSFELPPPGEALQLPPDW
jgi:hypothetical protein